MMNPVPEEPVRLGRPMGDDLLLENETLAMNFRSLRGQLAAVTAERDKARAENERLKGGITALADKWETAAGSTAGLARMIRENGDHQDTAEGHDIRADTYRHHAGELRKLVTP
jgi:hypothetical protein